MKSCVKTSSRDQAITTSEKKKLFGEENESGSNSSKTELQSSVLIAGSRNVTSMSNTRKRDAAAHSVELPVSAMPQDPS